MRWEPLGCCGVMTEGTDTFGVDAFLLARFCGRPRGAVCDLGTGCGIVAMLLAARTEAAPIVGVDIRPEATALFQAAIDRCGMGERLRALCADWRDLSMLPAGGFEAVTVNPPYFAVGRGIMPADPARRVARFGDADCYPSLCRAASRLLSPTGRLYLCLRPERVEEMLEAMAGAGLFPAARREVFSRPDRVALVLLAAGKGPAALADLPPWDMTDSDFIKELYEL